MDLLTRLQQPPDDRKVIWICDIEGGSGKSAFIRYCREETPAEVFSVTGGKAEDLARALANYLEKEEEEPNVVFIDVPRAAGNKVSYKFIEQLKNSEMTSTKYDSCHITLENVVHVVIMANEMPDLSCLSRDRWEIIEI